LHRTKNLAWWNRVGSRFEHSVVARTATIARLASALRSLLGRALHLFRTTLTSRGRSRELTVHEPIDIVPGAVAAAATARESALDGAGKLFIREVDDLVAHCCAQAESR
jgi:hypothetical protein